MTDEQFLRYIDITIERAIEAFKKAGITNQSKSVIYNDSVDMLKKYYREGKTDTRVTYAIYGLRFDPYYRIIPMYFEEGKKNEEIAEELDVDVSTVVRNKQRLCFLIYNELI